LIFLTSHQALRQELALALHLSIPTLIIPPPLPENRAHLPSYARAIASLLEIGGEGAQTRISIRIGISDRPPTAVVSPSAQGFGNTGNSMSSLAAPSLNGGRQPSYDYSAHQQTLSTVEEKRHKRKSSMGIPLRNSSYSQAPGAGSAANSAAQHHRLSLLSGSAGAAGGDYLSWSWEVWDCIRNICGYHRRLSLSMSLCLFLSVKIRSHVDLLALQRLT
jgi:protein arginine N-methyltransferase 5